ncbi:MAG: hypothetical protein JHD35_20835 [Sphingopyxis sp.]|nr:hypothetical protein [Sphingopyxis sp.]
MVRVWGPIAVAMLVALSGVPVAAAPSNAEQFGSLTKVPDQILGRWKMIGERCEEGETPSTKQVSAFLRLDPHFRYELTVEGWSWAGTYRVDRSSNSQLRIQLDATLYNFDLVDNRLENWGEGDATFLCGRIFEREK